MKLTENIKSIIEDIFNKVEYGSIHFSISPEKKTLDCRVENIYKITIDESLPKPLDKK